MFFAVRLTNYEIYNNNISTLSFYHIPGMVRIPEWSYVARNPNMHIYHVVYSRSLGEQQLAAEGVERTGV